MNRNDSAASSGASPPMWRRAVGMMLTAFGLSMLVTIGINAWIIGTTKARIYDHVGRLGNYDVALVLGTSPYTSSGVPNLLFKHRMLAAAELYAKGKVRHILVSGANPGYYNEPQEMYQALRRLGVPHDAITLGFAGYRTFDSIVRSKRVFGLSRYIIVSQRYHDYRALFIARHKGIDAVAYVRPEEDLRQPFLTVLREYFARVEAVLDLFVWNARPRFLGPSISIDIKTADAKPDLSCAVDPTPEMDDMQPRAPNYLSLPPGPLPIPGGDSIVQSQDGSIR